MLMRHPTGEGWKDAMSWVLSGLQFYNQKKSEEGEKTAFFLILKWTSCFIISFSSIRRGVFLSLHGQARTIMALWKNYFRSKYNELFHSEILPFHKLLYFYVWREHALAIINLPSALGRVWVSWHHCFIVLAHVWCFCCMVLLLSKPA